MKLSVVKENIVKNNNKIKGSRQLWIGEKRVLEIIEKIEKVEIIEEIEKDFLLDRENMVVIEIRDNRLIDKE